MFGIYLATKRNLNSKFRVQSILQTSLAEIIPPIDDPKGEDSFTEEHFTQQHAAFN